MKSRKFYSSLLVLAAVCFLLTGKTVMAATSAMRQSAQTTKTITVKWDDMTTLLTQHKNEPVTVNAYEIRWYDVDNTLLGKSDTLKADKRAFKVTGLAPNTSYKVKLRMLYTIDSTGKSVISSLTKTMFTIPGATKVTSFNYRKNQKGIKINWKAVSGSNPVSYQYQIVTPAGKKLKSGVTAGTSLVQASFKYYNRAVKIRIRPYVTDSNLKKYYGAWSSFKSLVPQPILYTDTSRYGVQADGTLKLKWDRVIHATKYEIWVSKTSATKGYKKAGSVSASLMKTGSTTMTVSVPTWNGKNKFERDTVYYVMVLTDTKDIGKSTKNYYMTCELSTK